MQKLKMYKILFIQLLFVVTAPVNIGWATDVLIS